jgi:glycosyltransferase involved in cell wall biosynthesis
VDFVEDAAALGQFEDEPIETIYASHNCRDTNMKIAVEGWRFIPHSYAVVNQYLCLEMLKRSQISLSHRDLPLFNPMWQKVRGLFSTEQESSLNELQTSFFQSDVLWRVSFPYNLQSDIEATYIFATAECYSVPACYVAGNQSILEAVKDSQSIIVTCSNWSLEGFLRSGIPIERIALIPLGFDADLCKPLEDELRNKLRTLSQLEDCFVFLNIGSIKTYKGIDILLKAFAQIASRYPQARLLLKGLDNVYASQDDLVEILNSLTEAEKYLVIPKLIYDGRILSFASCIQLYQLADAYVSPYRAEGFNLPVLEAAACGLPVICTQGGPTDDFTHSDFTLTIESEMTPRVLPKIGEHWVLEPDCEHLVVQMTEVIENHHFRVRAKQLGPAFVGEQFTWGKVTDRLLECFRLQFPC